MKNKKKASVKAKSTPVPEAPQDPRTGLKYLASGLMVGTLLDQILETPPEAFEFVIKSPHKDNSGILRLGAQRLLELQNALRDYATPERVAQALHRAPPEAREEMLNQLSPDDREAVEKAYNEISGA